MPKTIMDQMKILQTLTRKARDEENYNLLNSCLEITERLMSEIQTNQILADFLSHWLVSKASEENVSTDT